MSAARCKEFPVGRQARVRFRLLRDELARRRLGNLKGATCKFGLVIMTIKIWGSMATIEE